MHRSCEYVVKVIVGEACVYQGHWLVLFLIRCGEPPVWTCVTSIRTPAQLHKKRGTAERGHKEKWEGKVTVKRHDV